MYREPITQFVKEGKLYLPKNGGLNDYVKTVLKEAGISASDLAQKRTGKIELVLVRGEDIAQLVSDELKKGNPSFGLTGDDLFDEFLAGNKNTESLAVINTYDWLDEKARYGRPVLCIMNSTGNLEEISTGANIAINSKYQKTSQSYLNDRFKGKSLSITVYSGGTEDTVSAGTNQAAVDIVYSGNSIDDAKLKIAEVIRVSDLSLIGRSEIKNPWQFEYNRILRRAQQPTDSYTSKLLMDGNEAAKKLAMEAMELGREDILRENIKGEYLDVVYSSMVILARSQVPWKDVEELLKTRWK